MSRQWREIALVAALVAAPLIVLGSNRKAERDHNAFDRAVLTVTMPLQLAVDAAYDGLAEVWERYVALVRTADENDRLRRELAHVRGALAAASETAREVERLRRLVALADPPGYRPLGARVIALGPSPLFRSLRIDRGRGDGVLPGQGVVAATGAVGRVAAVSARAADVMLLVDANASVDVVVQRTRARGRLRGTGEDGVAGATLDYVLRTDEVALLDPVVTSGLDGVFPRGVLVGQVVELRARLFGLHQEVAVAPSADFEHLEELLVLVPLPPDLDALRAGLEPGELACVMPGDAQSDAPP